MNSLAGTVPHERAKLEDQCHQRDKVSTEELRLGPAALTFVFYAPGETTWPTQARYLFEEQRREEK